MDCCYRWGCLALVRLVLHQFLRSDSNHELASSEGWVDDMFKFCWTTLPSGRLTVTEGGRLTEGTEGRNPKHGRGWTMGFGVGAVGLQVARRRCRVAVIFATPRPRRRGGAPRRRAEQMVFSCVLPAARPRTRAVTRRGLFLPSWVNIPLELRNPI